MVANKLPIGIQTFSELINGDYIYIDKTKYFLDLITRGKCYFISRPRRFGKSLTISTLEDIFLGNKELFKGLYIHDQDYDWATYPIIRIDFSKNKIEDASGLEKHLVSTLVETAKAYELTLEEMDLTFALNELISKLSEKYEKQVVVLVDEYDKAILDNLTGDAENLEEIRNVLRGFYSVFKACEGQLKFILLTGVTKFAKTGVFSGLNNLDDLTMKPQAAQMIGITYEEMLKGYPGYIKDLGEAAELTSGETLEKIQEWYNGFRFSEINKKVYNPFSLLNLFDSLQFKNYWFETGTPKFLMDLLKVQDFDLVNLRSMLIKPEAFSTFLPEELNMMALLYQTGYLTIVDYNKQLEVYSLDFPNKEVSRSFSSYLLNAFAVKKQGFDFATQMYVALAENNVESFLKYFESIYAGVDHCLHINQEKYYQTIFYLTLKLMGFIVKVEQQTSNGRMDAIITYQDFIYIIEFKIDQSSEAALNQIKDKEYYKPYLNQNKTITLIGLNFNIEDKSLDMPIAEVLKV